MSKQQNANTEKKINESSKAIKNVGGIMGPGNKEMNLDAFSNLESQFAFEMTNESQSMMIKQILAEKNSQILKKDPKFLNDFEDDYDDDDI